MDARTMQLLKEWRFQQRRDLLRLGFNPFDKEQVVFQNFDNEVVHPNLVAVWNKRICDKNGLRRIKIHGFRHTHASLLCSYGRRIITARTCKHSNYNGHIHSRY